MRTIQLLGVGKMTRRYLDESEANSAIRRGKSVEIFLGPCEASGESGIRWASASRVESGVELSVFEVQDEGSPEYLDIYEFTPLRDDLCPGEPTERVNIASVSEIGAFVRSRYGIAMPGLVNEGVVQDEYKTYIEARQGQ
ncbi:hypothetical protein [Shewanella algae]|uniref:hypothetical protein n=1 Tax=Shewanella algae TaxID=38313 RepID=UPI00101E9AC0